jgi:hypothetical protein
MNEWEAAHHTWRQIAKKLGCLALCRRSRRLDGAERQVTLPDYGLGARIGDLGRQIRDVHSLNALQCYLITDHCRAGLHLLERLSFSSVS